MTAIDPVVQASSLDRESLGAGRVPQGDGGLPVVLGERRAEHVRQAGDTGLRVVAVAGEQGVPVGRSPQGEEQRCLGVEHREPGGAVAHHAAQGRHGQGCGALVAER